MEVQNGSAAPGATRRWQRHPQRKAIVRASAPRQSSLLNGIPAMGAGRPGRQLPGFTMIELLAFVTIVALIVALLLPAAQAGRESARMNACRNNVRQLAAAMLHHESAMGHFPSGGWGPNWMGAADRGSETAQPGGWTFDVLPFLEANPVRELVSGVDATTAAGAYQQMVTTPLPFFACPGRRTAKVVSLPNSVSYRTAVGVLALPLGTVTDYVACGGSTATCPPIALLEEAIKFVASDTKVTFCHVPQGNSSNYQTQSLSLSATEQGHADHDGDHIGPCYSCDDDMAAVAADPLSLDEGDAWRALVPLGRLVLPDNGIPDLQDGLVHRMSRITAPIVRDGLSNTYLVGEKYVAANRYDSGSDAGDNRVLFAGYSSSNVRWAYDPPAQDQVGVSRPNVFGSAHRGGWNVSFADGSVRTMDFGVDAAVHAGLAARADNRFTLPVD